LRRLGAPRFEANNPPERSCAEAKEAANKVMVLEVRRIQAAGPGRVPATPSEVGRSEIPFPQGHGEKCVSFAGRIRRRNGSCLYSSPPASCLWVTVPEGAKVPSKGGGASSTIEQLRVR
jgi:hypothetical protein